MIQISNFDWDEQNLEHIHGHHVEDYEVEEVLLFDEPIYYRRKEGKYCVFGITDRGRYLFIVLVIKEADLIRIITARSMTKVEKSLYNRRK
jgi:uncharacterized DUF497 family protein